MNTDTTENLFSRTKARRQYVLKRLGVIGFSVTVFAALFSLNALEGIEKKSLDFWMSFPFSFKSSPSSVVILSISQKSLNAVGLWPWPNRYHARMFKILKKMGVRAIYLDDTLSRTTTEQDDALLAAELSKLATPVYFPAEEEIKNDFFGQGLSSLNVEKQHPKSWRRPLSIFENKVTGLGHRDFKVDEDGALRFWQPALELQGQVFKFISLKIFSDSAGEVLAGSFLRASPQLIPWNRATFRSMERVDYADLLDGFLAEGHGMKSAINPGIFKDKICWIGLTSENQTKLMRTPWGEKAAPVEVAAAVYQAFERGYQIQVASRWVSGLFFLGFVIGAFFLAGFFTGKKFWISAAGLIFVACILSPAAFFVFHFWLPVVSAVLFLLSAFISVLVLDAIVGSQERSSLFHLATRDGLTNLYVIRHFRVIMNQMTREACARKEALSIILMDIDHFKKINDTYGHPAGDKVLKKTAETIQAAVRQKRTLKDVDFVARYGGEEFIVLIRRNSLESTALRVAERIRTLIEKTAFEWEGKSIPVTVSLGVAVLGESENIPDPMVHRADKALYLAKQTGRNRVKTEADVQSAAGGEPSLF